VTEVIATFPLGPINVTSAGVNVAGTMGWLNVTLIVESELLVGPLAVALMTTGGRAIVNAV
jgi:hypothetical protein